MRESIFIDSKNPFIDITSWWWWLWWWCVCVVVVVVVVVVCVRVSVWWL